MGIFDELKKQQAAQQASAAPAVVPPKPANPLDGILKKKEPQNVVTAPSPAVQPAQAGNQTISEKPAAPVNKPNPLDGLLGRKPQPAPASVASTPVGEPPIGATQIPGTAKPTLGTTVQPIADDQKLMVDELKNSLDYLVKNIDDKDIIGNVVRTILTRLQANPDLCVFMTDQDFNMITRGARAAFKFEAMKAADKKVAKGKTTERQSKIALDLSGLDFAFKTKP